MRLFILQIHIFRYNNYARTSFRPTRLTHYINKNMTNFATFLATHQWVIILAAIWTIPWKGVALWRAARNQSTAWFVVLLVINTLGILEIVYIFVFSKRTETNMEAGDKSEEPQPIEPQEIPKPEKKVLDIKGEEKKEEEKPSLDEETLKS